MSQVRDLMGFIFRAIIAGLALAFILVYLWPSFAQRLSNQDLTTPAVTESAPRSYADAVNRAAPAVVSLQIRRIQPRADGTRTVFRMSRNDGSGVIMSEDGYILTNHHVVGNAQTVRVALWDGRVVLAETVGTDPETDLAVLKIRQSGLPTAPVDENTQVRPGDVVLAIGNAVGLSHTVTMGIVSATGRNDLRANVYEDYIQTDAAINNGNSGGALINSHGALVGISTLNNADAQNIGFAIPIGLAVNVMNQIIDYGSVRRGWLGALFSDLPLSLQTDGSSIRRGIQVRDVTPDGPAWSAGIRPGDILLSIDGVEIGDARALMLMIAQRQPGGRAEFQVQRNNQVFETYATLIQQPPLR